MTIHRSDISCGIRVITGLRESPRQLLQQIYNTSTRPDGGAGGISKGAFFIYSDNTARRGGQNLTDFLVEKDLGTVYDTPARFNPNSGNDIVMWTFQPNWTAINRYVRNHPLRGAMGL